MHALYIPTMRIPLLVSLAILLAACASQQVAQQASGPSAPQPSAPAAPPPAAPETQKALPDWSDRVNDPAGAAAILAVEKDFEGHPLPPEVASAPAEQIFRNLLVLHGMTAKRVIGAMHGMSTALGDRCSACHVDEKFAADDKKEKRTARKMLLLTQRLNAEDFHGHIALSCYTCHRGEEHPESAPADLAQRLSAMQLPPSLPAVPPDAKRADQVYKNLKVLGGLEPKQLVPAMQQMSLSLGMRCDACHVPGDWASDDKRAKKTARHMILLAQSANAELFGTSRGDDAVTCWTCHRGSEHPRKLPTDTDSH